MTFTAKTYNTLNNMRLSNALLHKCVNPFVHLLIIIMKNAYLMRRDVAWVGFWVCLSVTLGSCEDYSDYLHSVMQSYLVESEKLDSAKTDSIIRFVAKVQRLTQAYPSLQKDPSYSQIMQNIPVASLNITITGATWKDEKTIELGKENRVKEGKP